MRIKEHLYGSKNEMHLRLIQLDPADVELFVARGTLVCQWATAAGFPTLEIIDGEISAKRTLLEAVNVARARRSGTPAPPRASEPSSTPSTKASWCTTHRAK